MKLDGLYRTPTPTARVCLWYQNGQKNAEPKTAFVVADESNGRGILTLAVLVSGRRMEQYGPVRHADDPYLLKRPTAKNEGVWDYLPSEKANLKKPTAKKSDG